MEEIQIAIKRVRPGGAPASLPAYMTEGAAGMDLCADLSHDIQLGPLQRTLIPTGIAIALPFGYEAQIRPRSGIALKEGLTLINSPGTIDADYRGEIQLIAINLGSDINHHSAGTEDRTNDNSTGCARALARSRRIASFRAAGGRLWPYR